jgi:hypothetical protein
VETTASIAPTASGQRPKRMERMRWTLIKAIKFMTYDKVIIIFEKDDQVLVKGEVLAREDADLTADYLVQNFWTMHKAAQEN